MTAPLTQGSLCPPSNKRTYPLRHRPKTPWDMGSHGGACPPVSAAPSIAPPRGAYRRVPLVPVDKIVAVGGPGAERRMHSFQPPGVFWYFSAKGKVQSSRQDQVTMEKQKHCGTATQHNPSVTSGDSSPCTGEPLSAPKTSGRLRYVTGQNAVGYGLPRWGVPVAKEATDKTKQQRKK